ncbi:MAG: antitoxin [Acidithiobacillus sp.]
MHTERHVRFFRNGRNQAVRIPREFEMDAQEAIMRREDDRLIIEPVRRKGLLATLASLSVLDEDFPDTDRDLLPLAGNLYNLAAS